MPDGLFPSQVGKVLRPHQIEAIQLTKSSFLGKGNRRVLLQGPVGFGKTLVAAEIIKAALAKGNQVIFTAPQVNLIEQTVAAFEAEGIRDVGVMQGNHPRTDPLARVQVASVQTLARRRIPDAALVIADEAHIRANVIEELMAQRPDVYFLGLSATPCCGALHAGRFCPSCGAERKPFSVVKHGDGELVEITGNKTRAPAMSEKRDRLAGLLWIARERRYDRGWAAQKFRTWHGT